MRIYQRYFRVTAGPLMDKARELEAGQAAVREEILSFCTEIGAENAMSYRDGRWAGFKFAQNPDQNVWKNPNSFGYYWPRKNTASGREMLKRIEALPCAKHIQSAIEAIGLVEGFPVLIDARNGHCATMTGSPKLGVLFIGVPWRDVSPEEMERYRRDNDAGRHYSAEMEHLAWQPTPDMVEIKRWQLDKEIDELNASLFKGNKSASGVAV